MQQRYSVKEIEKNLPDQFVFYQNKHQYNFERADNGLFRITGGNNGCVGQTYEGEALSRWLHQRTYDERIDDLTADEFIDQLNAPVDLDVAAVYGLL